MLFNPKQGRPSVANLIMRLEAEDDLNTTYDTRNPRACLIAVLYGEVIPRLSIYDDALAGVVYTKPYTYGAALKRAKEAMGCE